MIYILLGLLTWSLAEYIVHRFILHSFSMPFWREHMKHHKYPHAETGVPYHLVVFCAAAALAVSAVLGFSPMMFVIGVVIGYVLYVTIHETMHAREYLSGPMAALQRLHNKHHINWHGNYGVTTPLWDIVFCTTTPTLKGPTSAHG